MVAADPRRPIECPTNHLNHLTLSSRTPIASVYDLATLITDCCANVFDQYHIPDEFQFLDFFERFIGAVVDGEAQFLQEFTEGLDRLNRSPDADSVELLSISRETKLLVEIKDIRDELSILKMVLKDQETTMTQMWGIIEDAKIKPGKEQDPHASYKRNRILEIHLFRIKKMEELANKAYDEIKHLLDLKQKQANISEALSARKQAENIAEQSRIAAGHAKDGARQAELGVEQSALLVEQAALAGKQAEETARQGKTLLVFTIITIVF
ncbi:uncharacterized protein K444DRAFT_701550 [Hyaloscypha bicolor E]|uniref:Uncharacterized protein n=1 Tax=Hyaloscypha bicolor E TaxID=1095630 RepID=A0A2J6TSQ8_9HELO|nr:uncharacterized protein K444DRAFT_701550 [Hyaloscypha bicolor E]PMD66047.1 hypothetical protein K444DRAFT_701550 [Hyaloscypha bicolor E]